MPHLPLLLFPTARPPCVLTYRRVTRAGADAKMKELLEKDKENESQVIAVTDPYRTCTYP